MLITGTLEKEVCSWSSFFPHLHFKPMTLLLLPWENQSTTDHSLLLDAPASSAFWDTSLSWVSFYGHLCSFAVTISPRCLHVELVQVQSFTFYSLNSLHWWCHLECTPAGFPIAVHVNSMLQVAQVLSIHDSFSHTHLQAIRNSAGFILKMYQELDSSSLPWLPLWSQSSPHYCIRVTSNRYLASALAWLKAPQLPKEAVKSRSYSSSQTC